MIRFLSAAVSLSILAGGVYLVSEYYNGKLLLLDSNPGVALELSNTVLQYFFVAALLAVFLVALLVYLIITTRVTARRLAYKMTKDIHLSQEQFRRFYDYSPVPYLLVSLHGAIERPNMASVRLLGLTQEQLLGKDVFDFIRTPEDTSRLEFIRGKVKHHVPVEKREAQVVPLDGIPRWVLLSVEYIRNPQGDFYALLTLVDIHEQKELDRIKTEFLSLASHQLRAPLANLKWYMDFLLARRASALNQEITEYLKKMYRRNEDMIDLVNTLLNMSRIEMGRVTVQKENTDVSSLARSVVEEMDPQAKEKQIQLSAEIPDGMVVHTDGRLLRIIMQNLLSNGVRYTPQGGQVTLQVERESKKLSIHVRDTGIGIPPEEQGRIFQKMYRAANAKEMEANGNGIGLYMCKALAESMGGNITFSTTVGQGTTFTVELAL